MRPLLVLSALALAAASRAVAYTLTTQDGSYSFDLNTPQTVLAAENFFPGTDDLAGTYLGSPIAEIDFVPNQDYGFGRGDYLGTTRGDRNANGVMEFALWRFDLGAFSHGGTYASTANFGYSGAPTPPPATLTVVGAVPEPASLAALSLGALALLRRRIRA